MDENIVFVDVMPDLIRYWVIEIGWDRFGIINSIRYRHLGPVTFLFARLEIEYACSSAYALFVFAYAFSNDDESMLINCSLSFKRNYDR